MAKIAIDGGGGGRLTVGGSVKMAGV